MRSTNGINKDVSDKKSNKTVDHCSFLPQQEKKSNNIFITDNSTPANKETDVRKTANFNSGF
jgi:hypothetical protein